MSHKDTKTALRKKGIRITDVKRLKNNAGYQLRGAGGEIVNVFDNGKIQVQGQNRKAVNEILATGTVTLDPPAVKNAQKPKVFVVYGQDMAKRNELEAMLRRWEVDPVILDQLPSGGATLIEKLNIYLDENDVRFGVVLATPDDVGYQQGSEDRKKPRTRQNVILELGMLLKALGRERVAILRPPRDEMESPSDIDGLIYCQYQNVVSDAKGELAREIENSIPGFTVPASRL